MKIIKLIGFLLLLHGSMCLNAQEQMKFVGTLRSQQDSTPIAYAHIGIPQLGVGTITNNEGRYELFINATNTDTFHISHISFQDLKLTARQLNDSVHFLIPSENTLDEVHVFPKDSLRFWLESICRRIKKHGPQGRNLSVGFYREVQFDSKHNKKSRLIEAAIELQDAKLSSPISKVRVRPIAVRKSDDNADHSLFYKVMTATFGDRNLLQESIVDCPVRSFRKRSKSKKDILNLLLRDTSAVLQIIKRQKLDDTELLTLSYKVKKNFMTWGEGEISFVKSSFRIVKFREHVYDTLDKTLWDHVVKYRKVKGVNMPVFIRRIVMSDMRQVQGDGVLGYSVSTFILTKHYVNKHDFDRVKRRQAIEKEIDFYDQEYTYNPEFWKRYNILLEEPLDPAVITDLSQKKSLEAQFRSNTKSDNDE